MGTLKPFTLHLFFLVFGLFKSGYTAPIEIRNLSLEQICSQLTLETLCFDGVKKLNLSVMENSALFPVHRLGNRNQLCRGIYIFNYTIDSEVLSIQETDEKNESAPFTIWAQAGLDREEREFYNFSVTCHLKPINGSNQLDTSSTTTIPGQFKVMDENDSPIVFQEKLEEKIIHVFFSFLHNPFEPGKRLNPESHTALVVRDKDSRDVNNITMKSLNDTKGLLAYDLQFHICPPPICKISSTIVYPKIFLTTNATTTRHWDGDYCVAANLTDESQVTQHHPLAYIICLGWSEEKQNVSFDGPKLGVFEPDSKQNNSSVGIYETDVKPKSIFEEKNEIPQSAESHCGHSCVLSYVLGSVASVFGILFVIFIFGFWRRQGHKKRKSTQSLVVNPSDMELSNGFGDRGGNRNLLPDEEYAASSGLTTRSNGFFPTNAQFNPDNFFQVESKWEIPREYLRLDHVLGEGEFGRVLKGVMRSSTGMIHVAVKMLKVDETEGNKSLRQEFMAEFSLLKQLDHTNVIKLLGASTSNRGIPLLVMEYAEFGSLRSFLRKCRRIEKLNHVCDKPEWNEGGGRISHFRNSQEISDHFVTPQEVLGFSWQIAKGMAYLSDMKMVHRDLAARNVLITKTKMCKISDFGLARDIYVDDAYKKKSKDRVPVKWLAPECLTDEFYTTKSDVWAFGILIWELAMLGQSPYPGIQTELLYSLLDSGYRMPQPDSCSNEVYAIMKKCWAKVPSDRPTFHELVFELSRLLEDGIEYLKLDIPSVSNPGYDIFNNDDSITPNNISTTTSTIITVSS